MAWQLFGALRFGSYLGFCVSQSLLKLAAMMGFSLWLWKDESEPPLLQILLVQRLRLFYGIRERLRFFKGGYSLSLKFNLANGGFSSSVTKKKKINNPFISKMPSIPFFYDDDDDDYDNSDGYNSDNMEKAEYMDSP